MVGCKAWLVREKNEFAATVVFAETRGKAKSMAMNTEVCEDVDFTNIEVHRLKCADKYYKPGKRELDWYNSADRIAMVKDCGFTCIPDAHCAEECTDCPAVADFCPVVNYPGVCRYEEEEEKEGKDG